MSYWHADDAYDIDTPIDVISANAHARLNHQGQARMDIHTWNGLSDSGKQTWDALSEEDKARILQVVNGNHQPPPIADGLRTPRPPPHGRGRWSRSWSSSSTQRQYP